MACRNKNGMHFIILWKEKLNQIRPKDSQSFEK